MLRTFGGWLLVAIVAAGSMGSSARGEELPPEQVQFNRDIRPLLSENCFRCHGQDVDARQAELRLDSEKGMLADLGERHAVVRGKSQESELYLRVAAEDVTERMPPEDAGKSLSPREIALIKAWIDQGAVWQGHWAFRPLERPQVPQLDSPGGDGNPVDRFVLRRLKTEGLNPVPRADRRTLIRRLGIDLLGLPPSPEEVDAFLSDESPAAYEKLVERLLANPHFGERMALHWLDLVRYADSVGYHGDQPMSVWPYRDYVIAAFNGNMPYDRFTLEQLAGDLLPEATRAQLVASGYNRLNMMTAEGGAQDKEYLAKYAADRVRTTSTVWLGVTLGCAECHDHKFDPFTMHDFYSFAAFFADIKEKGFYGGAHETGSWGPTMRLSTPAQAAELTALNEQVTSLEKTAKTTTTELEAAQHQWEEEVTGKSVTWKVLRPETATASGGQDLQLLEDGSLFSVGGSSQEGVYRLMIRTPIRNITAVRLDAVKDNRLPNGGPGRHVEGKFLIKEIIVTANGNRVKLSGGHASQSQPGYNVACAVDGDDATAWSVRDFFGTSHFAVFHADVTASLEAAGDPITLELEIRQGDVLGRFRVSVSTDKNAAAVAAAVRVQNILAVTRDQRSEEQNKDLAKNYRSVAPQLESTRRELSVATLRRNSLLEDIPKTLVSKATDPRTMRLLPRGNWMDESGPVVLPATPESLTNLKVDGRPLSRVDLAGWLTSGDNPPASRVFVNRIWRMLFGTGISKVLDDIGAQGEWPTHPELLDWLSADFVESGWDVKHLFRTIVTSETYQRSSSASKELITLDPYNRLLARQSNFRLPAEIVRDNALVISGLLEQEIGGRSTRPYQPAGYYAQLNFPKRAYQHDRDRNQYRRGVYTHWQRTFLHPMLGAFDAPNREECTAERPRSNTPLAALVLLNDPTFVEASRVLAERLIDSGGSTAEERIASAYRRALSRAPTTDELSLLNGLFQEQLARYRADPDAADALCHTGVSPVPENVNLAELAAWTAITRVILNLHETITRY